MARCSDHKNPLLHPGTGQEQRLPAGLRSGYVRVDEKDFADWIVFAQKFAAYLNYYNLRNEISGNWQGFFSHDISAVLGTVAIQSAEQYRIAIGERLKPLQSANDESDITELKTALGDLFSALFSFSKALDDLLRLLPEENPGEPDKTIFLRSTVENLVQLRLKPALSQTIFYYKGGQELHLITENVAAGWSLLNKPVDNASLIVLLGLEERWWKPENGLPVASWKDYYDGINNTTPPDTSIYGTAAEDDKKLAHLANHNLFKGVLDDYLSAFSKIVSEAERQLLQTLTDWDTHPAHYTLFLAFLKLFRLGQQHLNTLTQRHLDFYYNDVLRLQPKAASPDSAHVIITLAKGTDSLPLPAGTLFRGGKDSAGNEVLYALDKEVVFNKATVSGLMAWYKGTANDNTATVTNAQRLFAAPVMASEDGLGKELTTEFKEWHPYVVRDKATGVVAMPKAQVGFALASHYLFLAEGERRVKIRLAGSDNTLLQSLLVDVYLTTEKGWLKLTTAAWTAATVDATNYAVLTFVLEGDAPAVTAYDAKVHGGTFGVTVPVVKVVLRNEDTQAYTFSDAVAALTLTKAAIDVQVGLEPNGTAANDKGLRQLLVSGDAGIVDVSKPFKPFGALPKKGAYFIIGNREIFIKKGAKFKVNVEWAKLLQSIGNIDYDPTEPPDSGYYPDATMQFLEKGLWSGGTPVSFLSGTTAKVGFPSALTAVPATGNASFIDEYKAYDQTSKNGFVRFTLNNSFGHTAYQNALTIYLINKANKVPDINNPLPVEPYTPEVGAITVSYSATVSSDLTTTSEATFNSRELKFFHLYPFGEAEQHRFISGSSTVFLLPQFTHADGNANTVWHQGELYIGLKDLQPAQSVNLLIQVLEGSTDPLTAKPEDHVHWSYLAHNTWQAFDERAYDDATNGLIQSGIISFIVPPDATAENTVLPAGYIWLQASIKEKPEAVCEVLSITAQAAKVTLQPAGVAPDFLGTPLPAGTLSKLKTPLTAVKKIEQPYPSFGGRTAEAPDWFYVRVSERLRHKSRAITVWDYERLVLEAFPQLHKVKCLNHTRIEDDLYNEVAPGYVSIITIPKTVQRNDVNPLKPYTNLDLLEEIRDYLQKKTSCHVKVLAKQPQFEEVKMMFALKLYDGYEFAYYSNLLKEEITKALSPWAYSGATEIDFGGKIHKSVLINFIEERYYVDYISNVQLIHVTEGNADKEVVEASTARSILVSVPASQHEIEPVDDNSTNVINEICNECGKA